MRKARFFLPIVLLATLAASCGGGGGASLKGDDVAVVGKTHISNAQFDAEMAQAKQSYKQAGQAFPKQGTTNYETVKGQAVTVLVQQAEQIEKSSSLGINVTDKQIQARLTSIKKQYFAGSETRYKAQLKKIHLTDAQVRETIKATLIGEGLFKKETGGITVSNDEVHQYYVGHLQSYSQTQTRNVRHILVKSKSLADSLYAQLKSGNDQTWCTLAKKYSQDPSSKDQCGRLTISKGQTVAEFDRAAFSLPTKGIAKPVHSARYGWFVIQALAPVHPRSTTPEKQVSATIKQTLLKQKKDDAMNAWVATVSKQFCSGSKIKYQVGYAPNPDPCASINTTTT